MLDHEYSETPCNNSYGKIIECDYHSKGYGMTDKQIKKCTKCYLNFLRAGKPLKEDILEWRNDT